MSSTKESTKSTSAEKAAAKKALGTKNLAHSHPEVVAKRMQDIVSMVDSGQVLGKDVEKVQIPTSVIFM